MAMLAACFQLFDGLGCLPKGPAFIEGGMGSGFARQDEVATLMSYQLTKGLVAVESVTQ